MLKLSNAPFKLAHDFELRLQKLIMSDGIDRYRIPKVSKFNNFHRKFSHYKLGLHFECGNFVEYRKLRAYTKTLRIFK